MSKNERDEGNGSPPDRRHDVPKVWKSEYASVLRLDVLGESNQGIADALNYSRGHIKRIKSMPEYKQMKAEILEGEAGGIVERTKAQLATMLPVAADVYLNVMTDKEAHNRDKISAADSVMDRHIPKVSRAQVEGQLQGAVFTITLPAGMTKDEFLGPSTEQVETDYEIVCSECGDSYAPDDQHTCDPSKLEASVRPQ